MLRSRSNRQQRPSESTDERHGRGSSSSSSAYGSYGGYPSSSASGGPMTVGIASGADDDDYGRRDDKSKQRRGSGRSAFGFMGGGGGGGTASKFKRGSSSFNGNNGNSNSVGRSSFSNRGNDKRHHGIGPSKHGSSGGGGAPGGNTPLILFCFVVVATAAMGGATLHYRRMIERIEHELTVTQGRRRHGGRFQRRRDNFRPDDDDDDDAAAAGGEPVDSRIMMELRNTRRTLEAESQEWSARATAASNEVQGLEARADHITVEKESYDKQLAVLRDRLAEEEERSRAFKRTFQETHKNGSTGIVAGGPGQMIVQMKEIRNMESLDDYEDFVQRREDALWDKIDVLVEKLGRESRREAEEWFGPGPHSIELDIEYPKYAEDIPDPSSWPRARVTLQIEMAPLSLMPIAVNLFLQQVHHKLWNGSTFVINAMHILQAGPHRYNPKSASLYNVSALSEAFTKARLDKMPFQEYSEEYPHAQYTLGFAGRPGGPDFYINKIDNSVNHGPGGQSHHDLHEEADPCFAKVVGGLDVLEELNKIPVDATRGSLLMQPVIIVDSRVVSARAEAVPVQEEEARNVAAGNEEQQGKAPQEGGVVNDAKEQQEQQPQEAGTVNINQEQQPQETGEVNVDQKQQPQETGEVNVNQEQQGQQLQESDVDNNNGNSDVVSEIQIDGPVQNKKMPAMGPGRIG